MATILYFLLENYRIYNTHVLRIYFQNMPASIDDEQMLGIGRQVDDVELSPFENERGTGVLAVRHFPVIEVVGRGRCENVILDGDELAYNAVRFVAEGEGQFVGAPP